ncbi:MAG: hypothetical protein JXM75_12255, partial [Chromatiaceae bacterium]|nr:hypothetical protein [Chromatiaceae bacterium]
MKSLSVLLALTAALSAPMALAQVGEDTPDYDERVAKALRDSGVEYSIDADGDFRVVREMGGGRTQLAIVRSVTSEYRNFEIREIWSVGYESEGGQIPVQVANMMLEDTFQKKLGSWAKMDNLGVYMVKLSANADAESLFSALKLAMESADELEESLTGTEDAF